MKIDADGTPTEIVVNASGNAAPGETGEALTVLDGGLYFSAFTDTSGTNNQDLVKLDIDGLHNISTRAVPGDGSAAGEDERPLRVQSYALFQRVQRCGRTVRR